VADATARAVISAGRAPESRSDGRSLVTLADEVGLDTLALLWSDADPVSLPGVLWALYLLREWCHNQPDVVCRLWRAGAPQAAVDAVVAGCSAEVNEEDMRRTVDDIVARTYDGEAAVSLDRAAAFYRVIAAGRRELADEGTAWWSELGPRPPHVGQMAARNEAAATHLAAAARHWRSGTLG
jgi:hypothetical protein